MPCVLHVAEGTLVLEHLESGRRRPDFDERLGRGLAALHRFGAPGFGLDHDNFIGRLLQTDLKSQAAVSATGNTFTYSFPPKSVTSLVIDG